MHTLTTATGIAVAAASLCVIGASPAVAQSAPAGTYHSRAVALELTASGQARLSNSFGSLIVSSFLVAGDTITFRDEVGPAACAIERGIGRYLWRVDEDTLQFRVLSDACETRRTTLGVAWTRGNLPASSGAQLGPVVITARRQAEDAQRAPVSITVLPPEVLRDAAVTQPQSLTYLVPGLQVGALTGNAALLYMRGVGNFAGNSLQDPTVTFNFDGVYIARQTATGGLFYDLERVETLKGPQGTLYGRNATGGAVNIIPRRPELGTSTAEINAEYGEYNTVRADGALNLPLGPRAAIRIAGQRVGHAAYMADGTDDQNDWSGRFSLRYDATQAVAIRVVGDYYDQAGHGPGSTPIALGVDNRFGISSSEGAAYYASQRVNIAGRNWMAIPQVQNANDQHWGIDATVDWQTSLGALTMVSAARGSHLDATGSPSGNLVTDQEHSRQNSLEARLTSMPVSRVETLVGAFAFDEDIRTPDGEFFRPYNQFNLSLQRPQSGVTSGAVFGRATWHVTDRLRATLGSRYTHERKYFNGSFESFQKICAPPPSPPSCPNAQPFPVDTRVAPVVFPSDSPRVVVRNQDGTITQGFRILPHDEATFSRTTWRSALEYDVATRGLLYASFETGFKSGGFFFSNDADVYQPETVAALTLGLKSRLFSDRVQANVELFDWRYHDQQVSKISVDSKGATNLRTENIGQATIRGVEASLEYVPFLNTHLWADLEYLHAVYDSYTYQTPPPAAPVSGCPVTPQGTAGFLINCSGRHSPYAPEWTYGLQAAEIFALRSGPSFTARARARYQSQTLVGLDFIPQEQQPGYWILDASLTVANGDNRHSVGLFGQNLTKRTVMSNTFVVPFSSFAVGVLRPPRTLGVRVTERF
jgi:iron complex outermembrane receptor protein